MITGAGTARGASQSQRRDFLRSSEFIREFTIDMLGLIKDAA